VKITGRELPILRQLRGYSRGDFRSDLFAGVTTGVMLIPQGMAYALVAGMPPIYGLYAAVVPLVVYALLGSSRQLAVGPVAMGSLLVAAGVAPLAMGNPEKYIPLALLLAVMVGMIQVILGILRFGFLTRFLSRPVLTGFTSAAAFIIGVSQLKHLLGIPLPDTNRTPEIIIAAVKQIGRVQPLTVALAAAAIFLLAVLRWWRPRFPGPLVVVGLFTILTSTLGLEEMGVRTIGLVPGGLPGFMIPAPDRESVAALLPIAAAIALVAFMESIAVAQIYSVRHRYDINADQELIALGMANVAGGFFRSFPVSGGFSRTAVNDQAGARTSVAALVSAGVIAFTLLFLTGLFGSLPMAVLGAVVVVAVPSLVNPGEIVRLWQVDRRDFALMVATFLTTLFVGVPYGILTGVILSLGTLVYDDSRPHAAILGRLPGTRSWRNVDRYPEAEEVAGVKVFRVDAAFCFANAEFIRNQVGELVDNLPVPGALVFDFHAVNGIDSTALEQLRLIVNELDARKIHLLFAGVKGPVLDRMRRAGLYAELGVGRIFLENDDAVDAAVAWINQSGTEETRMTQM
jgi:SulP family sulfate permease